MMTQGSSIRSRPPRSTDSASSNGASAGSSAAGHGSASGALDAIASPIAPRSREATRVALLSPKTMSLEPVNLTALQSQLPIVETFHSIQGEGTWAGTNAFFIRLGGCDVGCPWCDTKESWNAKRHPLMSLEALVAEVDQRHPRLVVITGGEPCMHDLTELTAALRSTGARLHLETSGAYPLSGQFDWITLSPKFHRLPQPEFYGQANELKVVIASIQDFVWAETQLAQVSPTVPSYLQPEWGTPAAKDWVFEYVLSHPRWQMSLQTHKFLGIR